MKYLYIICGVILFVSCAKEINTKKFKEFEKSLNIKLKNEIVLNSEKEFDFPKSFDSKEIILKETENYYGKLDKAKLRELLAIEIKALESINIVKLEESSMAIISDSTKVIRKCGTYDTN